MEQRNVLNISQDADKNVSISSKSVMISDGSFLSALTVEIVAQIIYSY